MTCTSPGCDRPVRARGLCSTHYQAERRGPATQRRREPGMVSLGLGTLRISAEVLGALDAAVAERRLPSRSEAIREAIEQWIRRQAERREG